MPGYQSTVMFESKGQQVIPVQRFARRLGWSLALSALIAIVALLLGVVGFHYVAGLKWIDALHNSSMILGGMGPVAEMKTDGAKLFSSGYALFCGLVFISVIAVTLVPVLHRVLHKFHIDEADLKKKK
ncbi:MAG: putative rane protein [Betaproteobacteria bacterium]|nr:putative rane protein [Betaproteobacteria bacterium]